MAAPAFQTASTIGGAISASVAVPVPSGVAADNVILVWVYYESTATITPPAGFTLKDSVVCTGASAHVQRMFWKRATGADAGTYSFSWTGATWVHGSAIRVSGCITTGDPFGTPVNQATSNSVGSSASTPAVATLTPSTDDCLVIFSGTNYGAGASWTPPSGFTERIENGEFTAATLAQTTATATGSVSATAAGSDVGRTGLVSYLLPVPAAATVAGVAATATALAPAGVASAPVIPFPQAPLPLSVELFYSGVWNDITGYVQRRGNEGIRIKRGKSDEAGSLEPASASLMLNNRDGRFSPRNPIGPLYGLIGRNTPIRCSIVGASYLQINQASATTIGTPNVSTPDNAALDITGDIDLRCDIDLDSWSGQRIELLSKWTSSGNQRSYALCMEASGKISLFWSTNGTTVSADASIVVPIQTGRMTVRATLDANNGAGGYTTAFYYGTDGIAGSFTLLNTNATTSGTTSILSSSATMHVLDNPNATDLASWTTHGKVYGAQVRSGIAGTVVAEPDFTVLTDGATSFTDSASRVWTINGDLSATTKDIRFVHEVTVWPQKWDITGTDVYVPIETSGILRRISQGTAAFRSALFRGIVNQTATVAYWPCEDVDGSTSVASALFPGKPMTLTGGVPEFGAESGFAASAPILQLNSVALHGLVETFTATNFGQVQFLLHIPTGGTVTNSIITRINTGGTAAWWDLTYTTGGALTLTPYASDGTALTGSGAIGFAVDGKYLRVSVELTQNGANIGWKMVTLEPGSSSGLAQTGTLNSRTITRVTKVTMNPLRTLTDTAIGHVSVYKSLRDIFELRQELQAWAGERAGRRIERLCSEVGIPFEGLGNLDDTSQVGAQAPGELRTLIQEAVDVDLGLLYEPREAIALGYLPLSAIYTQPADLTLDYPSNQLAELEPVEDDQQLRNDVTVTRTGGTSARATLSSGTLSTQDPPDGVGTYDTSLSLNLFEDAQVGDAASWRTRLGTVDEARYPQIAVNLAHPEFFNNALLAQARGVDIGSRIAVTNLPAWLPPDALSALVQGYEEFLSNFEDAVTWNCSPSLPYETVGFYSGETVSAVSPARYSPDVDSTLNGAHNSTTTTLSVATASGALWDTGTGIYGDPWPFDIRVGGERMTVTDINNSTSPQAFTVTRSVNGVVKSHSSGAVVELWAPTYYAP